MKTKKIKIEERFKNAYRAFFDHEVLSAQSAIGLRNQTSITTIENELESTGNGDLAIKLLKRIFLFLPGTWLLFMASTFMFDIHILQSFGAQNVFVESFLSIIFAFSLYGFMTVFGLGNLRNIKHYLIPVTIIGASFLINLIFSLAPKSSQRDLFYFYSIYVFPLVLIAAVLVRNHGNKVEKREI